MKKKFRKILLFSLYTLLGSYFIIGTGITVSAKKNDKEAILPVENSWRYQDGEWIHSEENNERSLPENAWEKVDGNYINNKGEVIEGAVKKGIDVSEHNGKIDWERVKKSGVEFAIIRCGYGQDLKEQDDKEWINNVTECERLGIPYGVYLYSYADTVKKAQGEAKHVLRLLKGHTPTYPIYYDLEDEKMTLPLSKSLKGKIAKEFCDTLSDNGYKVGIYSNLNWWNNYLTDDVFDNPSWSKWVAQYNSHCDYKETYDIWQATSIGKIDGIEGNVDINFLMRNIQTNNETISIEYDNFSGNWYLYRNGKIDYSYTGIIENVNGWWYIDCGKINTDYSGIVQNVNGWWYIKNGKIATDYTGIIQSENSWYYIRNGKWNSEYEGIVENVNGWWYIDAGRINTDYSGIVQNVNGWWYIKNGKIATDYTGIIQSENSWYYIRNGKWNSEYEGIVENVNGWWYVKNGKIATEFSGTIVIKDREYIISNGFVIK